MNLRVNFKQQLVLKIVVSSVLILIIKKIIHRIPLYITTNQSHCLNNQSQWVLEDQELKVVDVENFKMILVCQAFLNLQEIWKLERLVVPYLKCLVSNIFLTENICLNFYHLVDNLKDRQITHISEMNLIINWTLIAEQVPLKNIWTQEIMVINLNLSETSNNQTKH